MGKQKRWREVAETADNWTRKEPVSDENKLPASNAELFIDRRDISEGRKLKETEEADPGVINRGLLKVGAEGDNLKARDLRPSSGTK